MALMPFMTGEFHSFEMMSKGFQRDSLIGAGGNEHRGRAADWGVRLKLDVAAAPPFHPPLYKSSQYERGDGSPAGQDA